MGTATASRKSCLKRSLADSIGNGGEEKEDFSDGSNVSNGGADKDVKPATAAVAQSLCWGDIVFYEFANILGDNPAAEGAPLTIKWKHDTKNVLAVEYYEYLRSSKPRRRRKDLMLSSAQRDTYLLGLGYRLDQLIEAAEETKKIRNSRRANMKGTTWDRFRSVFERQKKKNVLGNNPKIVVAKSG